MIHKSLNNILNRNWLQAGPYVEFSKNFKAAIINMFKNLKKIMPK